MRQHTQFHYCPRCGQSPIEAFTVKGMRCPHCDYIYFHNAACAVAGLIEVDSQILLIKRASPPQAGYLGFPGGFVDYAESLEDALRREIKEELNICLGDLIYLGSFPNAYKYREVTYFTTDIFYYSKINSIKNLRAHDLKEVMDPILMLPSAIDPRLLAFDSMRAALRLYLDQVKVA
jgi:ADP-ribose pyrophosphatase YjhB (NUDIX family)